MASAAALGIGGLQHRAPDHQIIAAGGNRACRRHDALLVAGCRPRRPDAGRHQHHLVADDLVQRRGLLRRTDEAVDAKHLRLLGAGLDQIGDAEPIAGGVEIAVVVGGQHGDGEDFQARAGAGLDRGLHGLRIGVHGQEGRAQFGDALDAARHGVADVMQLEIEEHLLAGIREPADQRQPAGIGELIADLVKGDGIAEPGDHRFRGCDLGQIKRHDQPVAGGDPGWLHVTSHHALGNFDQLPHQRSQRLDVGRLLQPVHIIIGFRWRTTARAGSE